ncbi:MAG: dockerin type I domain-containing protein, partial [Chthoniobacterales bacterium]
SFNTGIAARGRIYIAGDNKVTAFQVPKVPITSAVSRKTHTGVGAFDIDVLNGGVECRVGQGANHDTHQLVVTFGGAITINGSPQAQVVSGTANVSNVAVNGNTATIDLSGVANAQRLTVTLFGVSDGTNTADMPLSFTVLTGDTNGDEAVNSADATIARNASGQTADSNNFRSDVNCDGTINSADATIVRNASGTAPAASAIAEKSKRYLPPNER